MGNHRRNEMVIWVACMILVSLAFCVVLVRSAWIDNVSTVLEENPTAWNGDHVSNGGNKEWEEEDKALHAFNMQNWRNKILQSQIERQKTLWGLMNDCPTENWGGSGGCRDGGCTGCNAQSS